MNEELAERVTALGIVDRSIDFHTEELRRLRGLRASLATEIGELGGTPDSSREGGTAPLGAPGVPPVWTPPEEQERQRRLPGWTMATQARPYRPIEVSGLGPIVLGEIRYARILIKAEDIPTRFTVWALDGPIPQAHLKSDLSEFRGVADCGVKGPGTWWAPERAEMSVRVELCRDCALLIPGVSLPSP